MKKEKESIQFKANCLPIRIFQSPIFVVVCKLQIVNCNYSLMFATVRKRHDTN